MEELGCSHKVCFIASRSNTECHIAEARAERQMAQVEERQKKLADLAESALTEVD